MGNRQISIKCSISLSRIANELHFYGKKSIYMVVYKIKALAVAGIFLLLWGYDV